jgi:hypothetical protein
MSLVKVEALGYEPHEETSNSELSEHCEGPVPVEIAVQLMRSTDAGTTP